MEKETVELPKNILETLSDYVCLLGELLLVFCFFLQVDVKAG